MSGVAALLGRHEEARDHYQEAIRVCTEMRFRMELALSRLQLAELLLEQFLQEKSEAIAHLDFAIPDRDSECIPRHTKDYMGIRERISKNDKFLAWKLPKESGELQFRDMKMQPSLERALRHKEILKA